MWDINCALTLLSPLSKLDINHLVSAHVNTHMSWPNCFAPWHLCDSSILLKEEKDFKFLIDNIFTYFIVF